MQGTPEAPRCGFSRKVADALKGTGVDFGTFDILGDEEIRQGLKDFSQWPTYPQVFITTGIVIVLWPVWPPRTMICHNYNNDNSNDYFNNNDNNCYHNGNNNSYNNNYCPSFGISSQAALVAIHIRRVPASHYTGQRSSSTQVMAFQVNRALSGLNV